MEKAKKSATKDAKLTWQWEKKGTLFVGDCGTKPATKVASFDMDDTLIKVKSGAKFPKNADDWLFWSDEVPKRLVELDKEGYKLVIFTNQNGITKGHTSAQDIQTKIQNFCETSGVKIQAFIASADDEYRKPSTTMWDLLESTYNGKVKIDKKASFFCGDAAGRKTKTHKDFSDTDLKYALNVDVPFQTPEVCFLGEKEEKIEVKGFNPKSVPTTGELVEGEKGVKEFPYVEKEMIIFCGPPGGGKSTFWQTYLQKYERVNRDTLKTKEKCYKVAEEAILKGKSVVIDNTNPKKEDRAYFLGLAKKHGLSARCFFFNTNKDTCFHNDYMRVVNAVRKHLSGKAGSIPIHSWFKYLEEPQVGEGFKEIKKINFIAKFNDDEDKKAYEVFSKK